MKSTIHTAATLGLFFLTCLPSANTQTDTIYVRSDAVGNNNGADWPNAFTDLQDALAFASEGDEIRVAKGIYWPDTAGGSPASSFFIEKNLALLGGFVGTGPNPDERDFFAYPAVLSGDLNADDLPGDLDSNRADNVMTVLLVGPEVTNETLIDGFNIVNGHADGDQTQFEYARGGGVFSFGSPVISNCVFQNNFAAESGGGLYFHTMNANTAQVLDCVFQTNRAENGGGAMVYIAGEEGVLFKWCHFMGNSANEDGGGLRVYNSNCQIEGCVFDENQARRSGGAVDVRAIWDDNLTTISETDFNENTARNGGGVNFQTNSGLGAHNNHLLVNICAFSGNSAMQFDTTQNGDPQGGALRAIIDRTTNGCGAQVTNSKVLGNTSEGTSGGIHVSLEGQGASFFLGATVLENCQAETAGAIRITATDVGSGEATIEGCSIFSNSSEEAGGSVLLDGRGVSDVDFHIAASQISEGNAQTDGGAILLTVRDTATVDLLVENCQLERNQAAQAGVLFIERTGGEYHAHFQNCEFMENGAGTGAGEVFANAADTLGGSLLAFENCLFSENGGSGPILSADSFPGLSLLNCTIAGNEGPALNVAGNSSVALQNNIFHNLGNEELTGDFSSATILSHGGNFADDASFGPLFTTADQAGSGPLFIGTGDHPYQLAPGSPAIDAGVLPEDVSDLDLAGNARVVNCIDAGAYESPVSTGENCVVSGSGLVSNEWQFEVFPNPVGEVLQVLFENKTPGQVELLDAMGLVLRSKKIARSGPVKLDVADLPDGIYFLKMTTETGSVVRRVVVF